MWDQCLLVADVKICTLLYLIFIKSVYLNAVYQSCWLVLSFFFIFTAEHANSLRMWLCMKWHGAWLYRVHRTRWDSVSFMWHQPCRRFKKTTSVDIQERRYKKLVIHVQSHASAVSLLKSGERCYIKAVDNNNNLPLRVGIIIIWSCCFYHKITVTRFHVLSH